MFAPPLQPCSSLETNHTLFTNTTSTSGNTNGCSVSMSSQQIKSTLGIILPPNNIKGIIDKTAEFVAKNGLEFEQRVLADRSNGTKFAFLVPGNPYRPYYDAKLLEFQTGEGMIS
jgi:splicing factor 3A subunit 1